MIEAEVARRAAPVLARMLARLVDRGAVVGSDTPAPACEPGVAATTRPVTARGIAVVSVGADHGTRVEPTSTRPADPGATPL